MVLSKRVKEIKQNIDTLKSYDIKEAIEILKTSSKVTTSKISQEIL